MRTDLQLNVVTYKLRYYFAGQDTRVVTVLLMTGRARRVDPARPNQSGQSIFLLRRKVAPWFLLVLLTAL